MKTVKELTVSLRLSKVTIYKALKRDDLQEHIVKKDNITYIDEKGEQILIDLFSKASSKANSKSYSKSNNINNGKNDLTIQALINQLEIKDKQIESLTETIKHLSQSINAGQQERLAATVIESLPLPETSPAPEKVNLWNKIFKKKK